MAEIKEFRLGGAAGYSLIAYGSKTHAGVVYERVMFVSDTEPDYRRNVTHDDRGLAFLRSYYPDDCAHILGLLTEARKHLAMGAA